MSPSPPPVTRREAIGTIGAAGGAVVLAASDPAHPGRLLEAIGLSDDAQAAAVSCVLSPDRTEGPYFVDERLDRSDIRSDPGTGAVSAGTTLTLTMVVVDAAGGCAPVPGAQVDIWHADAKGRYSDIASEGTSGKRHLRGYQVTNASGQVTFTTIFPGWYEGRAIHIHFKIRAGGRTFTSQLFFDPAVSAAVTAGADYGRGTPDTPNARDAIFGSDGTKLLVPLTAQGGGYAGTFVAGVTGFAPSTGAGTGTTTAANTVQGALQKARFVRTRTGKRTLRLTIRADEDVTVLARLSRADRTIAKRTRKLATGTHTLDVAVPKATRKGRAKLSIRYSDGAGLARRASATITIPGRIGG